MCMWCHIDQCSFFCLKQMEGNTIHRSVKLKVVVGGIRLANYSSLIN